MDQISLRRKPGVEKKIKKGKDLVDRSAEIIFAGGSCSTRDGILGFVTLKR